ncbi:esterase FE4 isoform X2 [Megalopta genalis]|uniref:esterase FE4 isoform X2 n=1 Tax=Megalopta genalis TaxID=115081 RepID=UPI0014430C37|nr:esterase FE4-like isoform X2 [Megalopta genalis]
MQTRFTSCTKSIRRTQWSVVNKLIRLQSTMSDPIVTVKQGKLRGAVQENVLGLGRSFIAFHEIPFAAPPVGDLRFKDPQPPAPWTDVKDVRIPHGRRCTQLHELDVERVTGQEDCLYLNVYTNSLQECKPVMFWIHGGAFRVGSATFLEKQPDYLLAKDVVVVSTNHRLGAFGFLNLGHKLAPGNQGLKDLIAALEWVKENIANFGGDPNNVTVFGASTGGVLCHALSVSPRARGLFHKAILQSGLLNCSWVMNQSRPERCFKLAKLLGKDSTDPEEVLRYLRTIDAKKIVKAYEGILEVEELKALDLPFGLNPDYMADDPVLPFPLEKMITMDTTVPVIVGYTSHEFLMFMKDTTPPSIRRFNDWLPLTVKKLASLKNLSPEKTKKLYATVKETYLNGMPITMDNMDEFVRYVSDCYFGIPAKIFVEDRVKRSTPPTYFYVYTYVGTQITHTDALVKRVIKGASHVDEMAYLFYLASLRTDDPEPPAVGTKDRTMIERLTTMWTNFGKTGNPTPCLDEHIKVIWEPVTENDIRYLEIGDESVMVSMKPHIFSS